MPAAIVCGLVDNSLRGSSPRPVLYELDLYNILTLIGGGLRDQSLATIEKDLIFDGLDGTMTFRQ
jgi:hypothetical protein